MTTGAWQNVLMPNPADDSDITKPYRNIVNDVAIDPKTGAVLANAAWRSGDTYNGFYLSPTGANGTFKSVNPGGAINPKDIGNTEFAYSADGSRLYAVVESPTLLNTGRQSANTVLNGIYASRSGSVEGSVVADRGLPQARQQRFGAQDQLLRKGLRSGRPGLVQQLHRRGPEQP